MYQFRGTATGKIHVFDTKEDGTLTELSPGDGPALGPRFNAVCGEAFGRLSLPISVIDIEKANICKTCLEFERNAWKKKL